MTVLPQLIDIVGEDKVSTEEGDLRAYGLDWTRFYKPDPLAIVHVQTVDQVVRLVQFAKSTGLGLVPSGGRTGLSGGACALHGEVVVSFDKLNRVKSFNETDAAVTVEAGVVTAALQTFAREQGLYYPVDFASSGSSQIGGNIATNAGGIRVIRYGMTRQWVSGLKVVTGKGDILNLNEGLAKNNTGYDLRHLFIGSEGTLGFIVEATLQLAPLPRPCAVILLAVPKMADCLSILAGFRRQVTLNAFEFFSESALRHVMAHAQLPRLFADESAFYVLLEFENGDDGRMEAAADAYQYCLDQGWVTDGIVSGSERQNQELWQYRERISESITPATPYKNDLSVRISETPAFLMAVDEVVESGAPGFETVWFGHIGDGNLHLNILKPQELSIEDFRHECEQISEKVLSLVESHHGSISAEHGIGLLKKGQLHFSRSAEEIEAMRAVKRVFDPKSIMNPGKLL